MINVLICLNDKTLADVIKTGFQQFPTFKIYTVPPTRLVEVVQRRNHGAVVLDLGEAQKEGGGLVGAVRDANPEIEIMALGERQQKEKFNRLKVDLNIFTCIGLPLDPFELARRIIRLEKHLVERRPMAL